MKKLLCFVLSFILTAALLIPAAAAEDAGDIYAAATTPDGGEIILSGAPDAEEISDLDSYDLIIGGEAVLTVAQAEAPMLTAGAESGYFSAEFDLPDTTKTVFLAGLTADKVEEIQGKIIENYAGGRDFSLTDLSFIDAEKTNGYAADRNLCWAASASNILTYTGWAAQTDPAFTSSDDVFASFVDAFSDSGGSAYYGIGWFINGVNTFSLYNSTVASAKSGTGGYLKDYAYEQVCGTVDFSGSAVSGLRDILAYLKEGYGIALSLHVYHLGSYSGGHAITCWGYIADTAYEDSDPAYYTGLFVTDSDSDKWYINPKSAPNTLQFCTLAVGADSSGLPQFEFDLDSQNHAVMDGYVYLKPYSDELEKETSPDATRDKATTTDIFVREAYLDTRFSNTALAFNDVIESKTRFYYSPVMMNESDQDYYGNTHFKFTVTDSSGLTRTLSEFDTQVDIPVSYYTNFGRSLAYGNGLPEGDYLFTMAVNNTRSVAEAYYYNNTYSFPLKVRDSYLLGDTDGSGDVNVMDATKIQRIIADYDENADEKMLRRANVTGEPELNIVDATVIQLFVADYKTPYAVGEKLLYDCVG